MTGDRNSNEDRTAPQPKGAPNASRRRFLRGGVVAGGPLLVTTLANRPALAWNQYCNGTMPHSLAMSRSEQMAMNCQAYTPTEWKLDCDSNGGTSFTGCAHPALMPNKTWGDCKNGLGLQSIYCGGLDTDTIYQCLGDLSQAPLRAHIVAGCLNAVRWGNEGEGDANYDTYGFGLIEFCDWIRSNPTDALTRLRTIHGGD